MTLNQLLIQGLALFSFSVISAALAALWWAWAFGELRPAVSALRKHLPSPRILWAPAFVLVVVVLACLIGPP